MTTIRKLTVTAAALALAAAGSAAAATSAPAAHAAITGEIQLAEAPTWCITALNGLKAGSELVLGGCAQAQSQIFALNGAGELVNEQGGLCVTYNGANHAGDGNFGLLGNCVSAQSQIFSEEQVSGGVHWVMPYRVDSAGHHWTVDLKNNFIGFNSHIDEAGDGNYPSERWAGLG